MRPPTFTAFTIALLGNSLTVSAADGNPVIQRRMYGGWYGGGYGNCQGGACPPTGGYGGGYGGSYSNCQGGACPPTGGYGGGGYGGGGYERSSSWAGHGHEQQGYGRSSSLGGGGGGGPVRDTGTPVERPVKKENSKWPPGVKSEHYDDPDVIDHAGQAPSDCFYFLFEYAHPTRTVKGGWFKKDTKEPMGPKKWILRDRGSQQSGNSLSYQLFPLDAIFKTDDDCNVKANLPSNWWVVGRKRF
ncbi:hypothetical protein PspLS_03052 [Pyricularia sp. CBS 133598]|nr:hypothetical protein PspLS_03052 [Pyricularia sp. CBS 133598]